MNELALFAGAGGGILAAKLLGWRTICAVEKDPYAASVLLARQNDGLLPNFPIWDDVCTFDGRPWRGIVDVVSGGFPCQDISIAGSGKGLAGDRSGLWREMSRIIREVQPRIVFVENSPMLVSRGIEYVLGDLASMGFDAQWGVLGANAVGAPHRRERIWIVANANRARELQQKGRKQKQRGRASNSSQVRNPLREGCEERNVFAGGKNSEGFTDARKAIERADWWKAEPDVGRVVDELAFRVDRIKCLGNGQVPQCAAEAFRLLTQRI